MIGLPYMGSKRKLANKIINKIMTDNPNAKYFYDLFGGGGAVSLSALQYNGLFGKFDTVYYNELNSGVTNLFRYLQSHGISDDMYNWVNRDKFFEVIKGDDWYSGFVGLVWSFGNNQKSYLYGKDIEHLKHLLHNITVYRDKDNFHEYNKKYGYIDEYVLTLPTIEERRSYIRNVNVLNTQQEHLQNLNRIKDITAIPNLNDLHITNLSYDDVVIDMPVDETIIYMDPPYQNTEKYKEKSLDFDKLKDYIHNSPYKVYLSEYGNNYDMKLVDSYNHKSILSSTNNSKNVSENLYCNR